MTLLLSPWQKIFGFTFSFWSLGKIGVFFRSLSWGYVTPSEQTVTIRKSQKRSKHLLFTFLSSFKRRYQTEKVFKVLQPLG